MASQEARWEKKSSQGRMPEKAEKGKPQDIWEEKLQDKLEDNSQTNSLENSQDNSQENSRDNAKNNSPNNSHDNSWIRGKQKLKHIAKVLMSYD